MTHAINCKVAADNDLTVGQAWRTVSTAESAAIMQCEAMWLTRVVTTLFTDTAEHTAPGLGLRSGLARQPPLPVSLSCSHNAGCRKVQYES